MQRWTRPLPAEPDREILSHVWTTSTCYKPLEIERKRFIQNRNSLFKCPCWSSGNNAVVWAGSNSTFRDLTIKDNPSIGLFLPAGTSNVTVANVLSTGNHPNLRNDMGLSVRIDGSGAQLVP